MITVYMNLTRTKYKCTNTTSSETTGPLFIAHLAGIKCFNVRARG